MESLAKAGALECFEGTHRAQYFFKNNPEDEIFLEKLLRYANDIQSKANAAQHSLFGADEEIMLPTIPLPKCPPWSSLEQLKNEKEITGFYISGHPLDNYKLEINSFCTVRIGEVLADMKAFKGKEFAFAGVVSDATHKVGKNGKPYGSFTVEDYFDSITLTIFSEDYLRNRHFLAPGTYVFIKARVEARYDSPDQVNVRINNIGLLNEVFERQAKLVTVTLPLSSVQPEMNAYISELARHHKGGCQLRFQVTDDEEKFHIDVLSRKYKVEVKEFVTGLEQFEEIKVKIS
jgi:DNA polymerase III subunit alpha